MNEKLRVWHVPQIPPGKPFHVEVASVEEGVKIMDTLAQYDRFQREHLIKGEYISMQGLEMYDDRITGAGREDIGWTDWWDSETGEENPRQYLKDKAKKPKPKDD